MDIINKIKKLQEERGWSDYELAIQATLTQSTIASMKSRHSAPKIETLQAICNAFNMTLSQFFKYSLISEFCHINPLLYTTPKNFTLSFFPFAFIILQHPNSLLIIFNTSKSLIFPRSQNKNLH